MESLLAIVHNSSFSIFLMIFLKELFELRAYGRRRKPRNVQKFLAAILKGNPRFFCVATKEPQYFVKDIPLKKAIQVCRLRGV
jgi:hypothetical protein